MSCGKREYEVMVPTYTINTPSLLNSEADKGYAYYMLRLLLTILITVAATIDVQAAAPSGHFQDRLLRLQREGNCLELPLFGVSTHQGRNPDDVNVKLASDIQARLVRFDLPWSDLEHQGQYDFHPYDRLIAELRRAGRSIILVLAYGHPDHSDGRTANGFPLPPRNPDQRAAYDRYVQAVAARYHGPDIIYEIWNEPNFRLFWPPVPDATAYGELLAGAVRSIRGVAPRATIISGGLANENNPSEFLYELTQARALDGVTGVAFHPYRPDGPENSLYDIAQFDGAAPAAAARPLWITEWGYSNTWLAKTDGGRGRQRSAVMIARLMLTAALAKARAVVVYDLIDDGTDPDDPEFNFGLYDYRFNPKPAAAAFRTLAGLMSSCNRYEFKVDAVQNIVTASFDFSNSVSYVVWTYAVGPPRDICLSTGDAIPTELEDIFGNRLHFTPCGGTSQVKVNISETLGPVILRAQNGLPK